MAAPIKHGLGVAIKQLPADQMVKVPPHQLHNNSQREAVLQHNFEVAQKIVEDKLASGQLHFNDETQTFAKEKGKWLGDAAEY